MPFFMYFIPSCWVASYPARWVDSYPFAGYDCTYSLGTTLPIRWVQTQSTNKRKDYSNVGSTLYPLMRKGRP